MPSQNLHVVIFLVIKRIPFDICMYVWLARRVIRVGTIKPVTVAMRFMCAKCGLETLKYFPDGKYEPPASCGGCKSKTIVPDRSNAITVDWQRVRLQEIATDDTREEVSLMKSCMLISSF